MKSDTLDTFKVSNGDELKKHRHARTGQVLDDVVRAVDPGDGDHFKEGEEEEVPRGRGRVEEGEGVDAAAAREDEAEREHGGGHGHHEQGLVPARGGELQRPGSIEKKISMSLA